MGRLHSLVGVNNELTDVSTALVRPALVLIQAWVAAGRPRSEARFGSFVSLAAVMGGIFEAAGVPGLLSNLGSFYEDADEEGSMWREFTQVWW
ncbi:MAG: hypothetical protein OEZ06_11695 [Myxococcales bacterium]|nr:hypothetical protein [Myxococcales bacterium]